MLERLEITKETERLMRFRGEAGLALELFDESISNLNILDREQFNEYFNICVGRIVDFARINYIDLDLMIRIIAKILREGETQRFKKFSQGRRCVIDDIQVRPMQACRTEYEFGSSKLLNSSMDDGHEEYQSVLSKLISSIHLAIKSLI